MKRNDRTHSFKHQLQKRGGLFHGTGRVRVPRRNRVYASPTSQKDPVVDGAELEACDLARLHFQQTL